MKKKNFVNVETNLVKKLVNRKSYTWSIHCSICTENIKSILIYSEFTLQGHLYIDYVYIYKCTYLILKKKLLQNNI